MRIFLDTGVLLAAILPRDPDHRAAVSILERLADGEWRSAHTSDFVVAEALNFVRMKVKRKETAEALIGIVFGADGVPPPVRSVIRIHGGRFGEALDLYRREFHRGLSLTDWTSVVAARAEDVDAIATFDEAFRSVVKVVAL